jgi:DNA-binding NarL/FixJ family response regulator
LPLVFSARDLEGGPVVALVLMCDDLDVALTVLVVDDHPAFRASARRLLELDGLSVVGEAPNGATGLRMARDLDPDVVLLDVGLPDLSGFDVAEELAGARSRVVLISSRSQKDLGSRVRENGVLGFISKERLSGAAILELVRPAA